jgi:hypothetical protein
VALADTARLIASLELEDKFSKRLGAANTSLNKFQSGLGQTGKGIGQLGAGVGHVATSLVKLGAVGVAAIGGFLAVNLKAGVEQVRLLELATAQTEAVLKSTQGVAGQTASSIRNLAEKYESLNAVIDDKVIQSTENMLLSFTNIRKEAFEPALQATLDLNQAMGGGEEGLQGAAIKIGKALNDPIKGLTALGKAGVLFTADQKARIKQLVAENDLYGAQKIILAEVSTEFGGRFAAAGNTAAGRTAALKDNVEDLQRTFAGPFANVLDRITGKLGDFLGEAGTVDAVTRLGSAIAGLFTDEAIDKGIGLLRSGLDLLSPANLGKAGDAIHGVFDFVKSIDFETIGRGLQITASIAKTAIDAFLSLPPEVQSIAIAALAANKLSGGLIGSGIGNVAGGLLKLALGSLKTITAGNVNVIGANVTGGGVPTGGGPPVAGPLPTGASLLRLIGTATIAAAALEVFGLVGAGIFQSLNPTQFGFNEVAGASGEFSNPQAAQTFAEKLSAKLGIPLADVKQGITDAVNNQGLTFNQAVKQLENTVRDQTPKLTSVFERSRATSADLLRLQQFESSQQAARAARLQALLAPLPFGIGQLIAKDFSPTVNVSVATTTFISASNVVRTLNSFTAAMGSGPGGALDASLL